MNKKRNLSNNGNLSTTLKVLTSRFRCFFVIFLFAISSFAQTPQTINFPDIPVLGYGDVSYTLNASASSGLPVRYVSSDVNVATVTGNTLTIKKTGFTIIKAFQDGNSSYFASEPAAQLLVICPKATLLVKADDKTIDQGQIPVLTYSISGFKKSENSSVVTGLPLFEMLPENPAPGSYPIVINKGSLSAVNYDFDLQDGLLTVLNGTLTQFLPDNDGLLNIFPNPANEFCIIKSDGESFDLSVYKVSGEILIREKNLNYNYFMTLQNFSPGLYLVHVTTKKGNKQQKLVVQ